jgi:hypothetical protein
MGHDALHYVKVDGVSVDEVRKVLDTVHGSGCKPDDFTGLFPESLPFTVKEFDELLEGVKDKANTRSGYDCSTLEWLSRQFPTATFTYNENTYESTYHCWYINGQSTDDTNDNEFHNYLIEKLGGNVDSLLVEFAKTMMSLDNE